MKKLSNVVAEFIFLFHSLFPVFAVIPKVQAPHSGLCQSPRYIQIRIHKCWQRLQNGFYKISASIKFHKK